MDATKKAVVEPPETAAPVKARPLSEHHAQHEAAKPGQPKPKQ